MLMFLLKIEQMLIFPHVFTLMYSTNPLELVQTGKQQQMDRGLDFSKSRIKRNNQTLYLGNFKIRRILQKKRSQF